jgi:hypothetical protein
VRDQSGIAGVVTRSESDTAVSSTKFRRALPRETPSRSGIAASLTVCRQTAEWRWRNPSPVFGARYPLISVAVASANPSTSTVQTSDRQVAGASATRSAS